MLCFFLLHSHFLSSSILDKKWECNQTVYKLLIGFKKAYDSIKKEALYNFLTEFGIPMKREAN
jgi:hypothetical protein